jgi:hypothetical protein
MSSSDIDPDARTETLPPVFTGRARPVMLAEDGTRILPWIDTDATPMALVAWDGPTAPLGAGADPDERERATLAQWVGEISVLLAVVICGVLAVALAIALATR